MNSCSIFSSFSQKILKKIKQLAFEDKIKIINSYIPEKAKLYIENNLLEELDYFKKKYSLDIKIFSDNSLIIPEYKIELLNKSKKLLNSYDNIKKLNLSNNKIEKFKKTEKIIKDKKTKIKTKPKKTKSKKKTRTLWKRRKKLN